MNYNVQFNACIRSEILLKLKFLFQTGASLLSTVRSAPELNEGGADSVDSKARGSDIKLHIDGVTTDDSETTVGFYIGDHRSSSGGVGSASPASTSQSPPLLDQGDSPSLGFLDNLGQTEGVEATMQRLPTPQVTFHVGMYTLSIHYIYKWPRHLYSVKNLIEWKNCNLELEVPVQHPQEKEII